MPATTQNLKLPYPLPTDPIADGADQIKALAETVDALIYKLKPYFIQAKETGSAGYGFVNYEGSVDCSQDFTHVVGAFTSQAWIISNLPTSPSVKAFVNFTKTEIIGNTVKVKGVGTPGGGQSNVNILVWGY